MASQVEITAPVGSLRDCLGDRVNKQFTPYPNLQTYVETERKRKGIVEEEDILPFMARSNSPVRVRFTPTTLNKRKSRVAETAKTAIFNYRPLKRKDNLSTLKFRAPDATLTTLQYLSPWLSVTKTDYKDPRLSDNGSVENSIIKTESQGGLPHTNTDSVIDLAQLESPVLSRTESQVKIELASRECSRINSSKSNSNEKRVTIIEPSEMSDVSRTKTRMLSPAKVYKSKTMDLKEPDGGVNFYSGYLPPEYSEKIAEKLKISEKPDSSQLESDDMSGLSNATSQFYKPLVGDRTLFKRASYPTQPKLMMSDIYQIRLEDRKRILNTHGQAPVHFSAFKDRGTTIVPKQKGAALDEAVRTQQRGIGSAHNVKTSRLQPKNSSMEQFQLQRERTYHLQKLAREMINK